MVRSTAASSVIIMATYGKLQLKVCEVPDMFDSVSASWQG